MKKSILVNVDEIQSYVRDLKRIPIISHQRQEEIFTRLSDIKITIKEKNLLLSELITGNLRFVITVAKTYQNQGMDLLDLISEGNIGLIKASERFDPTSGLKFISYAVWWVRQTILASLSENSRTIRIPSNLFQELQKQKKEKITEDDHHFPSNDQNELNLPYCIGLFNEINEDGDQLIDVIPNHNANNPENVLNSKTEIKKKVSIILSVLDEREKTIIQKYYGLSGNECNLDDLGEEFGCTKERVRQIRDKAIKKLRNKSFSLIKYL